MYKPELTPIVDSLEGNNVFVFIIIITKINNSTRITVIIVEFFKGVSQWDLAKQNETKRS